MSLTAAAIRIMAEKGMSAQDIADVAEAMEQAAPRLSPAAIRTRRWRERKAEASLGDVTVTRNGDVSHAGECAQVVNPSLPSLRSEEVKPTSPDGEVTPFRSKLAKPNGFARFWEAYPSKVGKPVAEKAYAKALKRIPGPDPPSVILAGVERAKASRKWREGIIPNPSTWLNQDRWDDQPAEIDPTHDRPHHDPKFEARQANLARAFAGADLAARQRWEP